MKRAAEKEAVLSSEQIAQSISELEAKHTEAVAAREAAELDCGRGWQQLLAGGESRLREALTKARDLEDALALGIDAARRDLAEAKERERRAARAARRDELVAILEKRGQVADALNAALDAVADTLAGYFELTRATRRLTGDLRSRETAQGTVAVGLAEGERFERLQTLVELGLRDRLPGLWSSHEAILATPGPINETLRNQGAQILAEFTERFIDTATEELPAG